MKRRVVMRGRLGGVHLIHLADGRFNLRKGRIWLDPQEVELARRWARKRAARDAWTAGRGQHPFVKLAAGAKWPTDHLLVAKLNRLGAGVHRQLVIVSGLRSLAEQRRLWDLWMSGRGNRAAYPNPNAPHVRGVAADTVYVTRSGAQRDIGKWRKLRRRANRLGLGFPVPGEAWHTQRYGT